MNKINWKLILGTLSSINGGLITGAALLQTLFGQNLTIQIVAVLGVAQIVIGAVNGQLATQGNLIKDVASMPGVQQISVNAQANPTLAAIAVSNAPEAAKVEAIPSAATAVANTARAG